MKLQFWSESRAEWIETTGAPVTDAPSRPLWLTYRVLDDAGATVAEFPVRVRTEDGGR